MIAVSTPPPSLLVCNRRLSPALRQALDQIRDQGYRVRYDDSSCTISNPGRDPQRHLHVQHCGSCEEAVGAAVRNFNHPTQRYSRDAAATGG